MCSIIGVGGRLHKVLGQIDLGILDSGEQSLPFGLLVFIIKQDFSYSFNYLYNISIFASYLALYDMLYFE